MLEIAQLCKSYHGRQVLPPVDFFLPAGQCLGITGENGSGKSTLLRLVVQIERPDSGDVRFAGRSILGDRAFLRKNIGYVPQQNDLMQDLTAGQQLSLWRSACGRSEPMPAYLNELLDLEPLLKVKTRELSGGMQRRVSIAMALMNDPRILVLDEATTGLDKDYTGRFLDYLELYLKKGGRILFCSHHAPELERLCGSCLRLTPNK